MNVPEKNIGLIQLSPYIPELSPAEQIWRLLRGQYFADKSFDSLSEAIFQADKGLSETASGSNALSRLTNWPCIKDIFYGYRILNKTAIIYTANLKASILNSFNRTGDGAEDNFTDSFNTPLGLKAELQRRQITVFVSR